MGRGPRRLALAAHLTSALGWLGAVASSLALGVAGLVSDDWGTVQGAYVGLELLGWYVLLPFSVASLFTGLISSLGTTWGLFRHYWVVAKLLLNLVATGVLLLYMQTLDYLATLAESDPAAVGGVSPVLHAGAALVLLVVATGLGLYKPRGLTRYGWRKQQERRPALAPQT